MIMEPYDVYRYYLALRLHFTTDQYDIVKQRGRVRASKQSFLKRKDLLSINKIAKTYNDSDVVNFLVANFVSGDRWGGVFDVEAADRYVGWKRRTESMQYMFTQDLDGICNAVAKNGCEFDVVFDCSTDQHPLLLKLYLRGAISVETLVILDSIYNYVQVFDQHLKDDIVWPDVSRVVKKYKPFLKFSKDKYNEIVVRRTGVA